ncbi:MAG: glycosyltransferase family 2 protein [Bacteroidota bacterium]
MIDVTIVLIAWNVRDLLEACLNSIIAHTRNITIEIILIDNNSEDGTKQMILEKFPMVQLLENSTNRGVAPARNQGIKKAKGKYVLILDADTKLIENSIEKLYIFMEQNNDCGIVGCKLLEKNGDLQHSCKRFPTVLALLFRRLEHINIINNSKILRSHKMTEWDHSSISDVDYVIGACQFMRMEYLNNVGFYDEKIFYGPEDMDVCIRMWRKGYTVCYYPHTQIYHFHQRITHRNIFSAITFEHLWGIFYIFLKYRGKFSRSVS